MGITTCVVVGDKVICWDAINKKIVGVKLIPDPKMQITDEEALVLFKKIVEQEQNDRS